MDLQSKKILMADDSAFMRNVLKNILENAGFSQFLEAENGVQALEMIKSEKPDLVLLDLIMPEKGGVDVLKEVGNTQKILIVSAVGQDSIMKEAMGFGALGFIVKPFDNALVVEAVKKALS
jgi:two-component system chemotaxis response regulator CheY